MLYLIDATNMNLAEYGPLGIFLSVTLTVIYILDKRYTKVIEANEVKCEDRAKKRADEFHEELRKLEEKLDKEIATHLEYRTNFRDVVVQEMKESKEFIKESKEVIRDHTKTTKELIHLVKNLAHEAGGTKNN